MRRGKNACEDAGGSLLASCVYAMLKTTDLRQIGPSQRVVVSQSAPKRMPYRKISTFHSIFRSIYIKYINYTWLYLIEIHMTGNFILIE